MFVCYSTASENGESKFENVAAEDDNPKFSRQENANQV